MRRPLTIVRHRFMLAAFLALLVGQEAAADVSVQVDERGTVQVTADQASNQVILEALSEKLDFAIVLEDGDWSTQVRRFERSGTPERVLEALLGSTNHLLSYRGDAVSGVTVLAAGAGTPTFISKPSTGSAAATGATATGQLSGMNADEGSSTPRWKQTGEPIAVAPTDTAEEEEAYDLVSASPSPTPVSSLLQSRAQAAADYNKPAPKSQPQSQSQSQEIKMPVMEPPLQEGIPAGIDLAELARLTQQAHQDVQNMAEQLSRAEAQMKANQPQ